MQSIIDKMAQQAEEKGRMQARIKAAIARIEVKDYEEALKLLKSLIQ